MEKVTLENLLKKNIDGKVICFPTDTIYGVGVKYNDLDGIDKIFKMKNRSENKPLAILVPSKDISKYVLKISDEAASFINNDWPGALTLIFKKSNLIDDKITKGLTTVAFRMPNSKVALAILEKFGPLATTSVNISGLPPLNDVSLIEKEFSDYIDYLVIDLEKTIGKASRIIDVSSEDIKIIRN